jgi:catechol 2,3-dioxygenase-like lactoylglutathione lyase family enzyme
MVNFYTQTLGFRLKRRFAIGNEDFQRGIGVLDAEANGAHLLVPNSDVEIELFQFREAEDVPSGSPANTQGYRHVALVVENLQETWRELEERYFVSVKPDYGKRTERSSRFSVCLFS